jgi:hypothetical protein
VIRAGDRVVSRDGRLGTVQVSLDQDRFLVAWDDDQENPVWMKHNQIEPVGS